jgi:hypothetical protein
MIYSLIRATQSAALITALCAQTQTKKIFERNAFKTFLVVRLLGNC